MKALLLLVDAAKAEASKKAEYRLQAYENCLLARAIKPTHCLALLQIANYLFNTWKVLVETHRADLCTAEGSRTLRLRIGDVSLKFGDLLRVRFSQTEEAFSYFVTSVAQTSPGVLLVELDRDLEPLAVQAVSLKELGEVLRLAEEAVHNSRSKETTAEGNFLLGKVYHIQGDVDSALKCYLKSLESGDMLLAAFNVAQILFSRRDFASSLAMSERIRLKYPSDKDTQAFIFLLNGLHKGEPCPFEALKDVAPGFQFESDLWLLQGQLRLKVPAEYPNALKCFLSALQLMKKSRVRIEPQLLANMAVLNHHLGRTHDALDHMREAIRSLAEHSAVANPDFECVEFEGVYFEWSDVVCSLHVDSDDRFKCVDPFVVLSGIITAGTSVLIGDVLHTVTEVGAEAFAASSPMSVLLLGTSDESDAVLPLRVKTNTASFYANTTFSYNYARILDESGSTQAAAEAYKALVAEHPSFTECTST